MLNYFFLLADIGAKWDRAFVLGRFSRLVYCLLVRLSVGTLLVDFTIKDKRSSLFCGSVSDDEKLV
jgi:hypothetical protein